MERPTWSNYATGDSTAHPDLWNGLIGLWVPRLGPTGRVLYDISGNGAHATQVNLDVSAAWKVSEGAYCIETDGVDGYWPLRAKANGDTAINETGFAFSFWFNTSSISGTNAICQLGSTQSDGSPRFYLRNDAAYYVAGAYDTTSIPDFVVGKWHHFAVTWNRNNNNLRIWLDGVKYQDTTAVVGSEPSQSFYLGAWSTNYLATKFDEFAFWHRQLTDQDVRVLCSYRGITCTRRQKISIPGQTSFAATITGTVAVTLDGLSSTASGTSGTGGGTGLTASQPLAFNLSDSLVIGG